MQQTICNQRSQTITLLPIFSSLSHAVQALGHLQRVEKACKLVKEGGYWFSCKLVTEEVAVSPCPLADCMLCTLSHLHRVE